MLRSNFCSSKRFCVGANFTHRLKKLQNNHNNNRSFTGVEFSRLFASRLFSSNFTNMAGKFTFEILQHQDDVTSNHVLEHFIHSKEFHDLAVAEGSDIIKRDQEDDVKLAKGIQLAVAKGVLPKDSGVSPSTKIDVVGKSADQVAAELLKYLPGRDGNVIILEGLSGTGKGTTVKKLQSLLPNCVCWSNGNVFRTFTYLVTEHCNANKIEFSPEILTPELLHSIGSRLEFKKIDGQGFDVVIDGTTRVGLIANTKLKEPVISARVPTVAEKTQGEVVKFAASAVDTLSKAGHNVILEGRFQTLQYIPSPYRFELVIGDVALLGQRRAAQRVMAAALNDLKAKEHPTVHDVEAALTHSLQSMLKQ